MSTTSIVEYQNTNLSRIRQFSNKQGCSVKRKRETKSNWWCEKKIRLSGGRWGNKLQERRTDPSRPDEDTYWCCSSLECDASEHDEGTNEQSRPSTQAIRNYWCEGQRLWGALTSSSLFGLAVKETYYDRPDNLRRTYEPYVWPLNELEEKTLELVHIPRVFPSGLLKYTCQSGRIWRPEDVQHQCRYWDGYWGLLPLTSDESSPFILDVSNGRHNQRFSRRIPRTQKIKYWGHFVLNTVEFRTLISPPRTSMNEVNNCPFGDSHQW